MRTLLALFAMSLRPRALLAGIDCCRARFASVFRSYSKSGTIADMVVPTLGAITGSEQVQQDTPEKACPTYSMTSSARASSCGGRTGKRAARGSHPVCRRPFLSDPTRFDHERVSGRQPGTRGGLLDPLSAGERLMLGVAGNPVDRSRKRTVACAAIPIHPGRRWPAFARPASVAFSCPLPFGALNVSTTKSVKTIPALIA